MLQSETKKWNSESFKFHWKETLAPVAGCCYYALIHFSPLTACAP